MITRSDLVTPARWPVRRLSAAWELWQYQKTSCLRRAYRTCAGHKADADDALQRALIVSGSLRRRQHNPGATASQHVA